MTITTPNWTIDDMPSLSASLGKSGCDRIRFHQHEGIASQNARERFVTNPHRQLMQETTVGCSGPIDDILSGVASLTDKATKPLSVKRLHVILQSANRISSGLLETCLAVDSRQARRYMAAIKLAIYHISRHLNQRGTHATT